MPHPSLHVLVISHAWPELSAPSAGNRQMQVLDSFLTSGWRVTFSSPAARSENTTDLTARGITEHRIEPDGSRFDGFVSEQAPDVVLFDHFTLEEQFGWRVERHCPDALRVLDVAELQSLRDARQVLLRQRLTFGLDPNDFRELFATSGPDLYRQMAPADLAQRELAAIYRSDLSLVVSDVEIDLLVNGFAVPPDLLHWCPPMLHPRGETPPPFAEREHFVSLANVRDAADWDAVLWLKHNLWPMIRRRLPEAQLHIHSLGSSPKAATLHAPEDGFLILENTDGPQQRLDEARVYLAPLRVGAGINGTLLDALQAGTPCATTPIGAQALQGALPWPGLVSETAEGLAQAAALLYSDEARWNQAQRDARQLLGARYDGRRHSAALAQRIEQTLEELPAQRLYNFTGTMLRRLQRKHPQTD